MKAYDITPGHLGEKITVENPVFGVSHRVDLMQGTLTEISAKKGYDVVTLRIDTLEVRVKLESEVKIR